MRFIDINKLKTAADTIKWATLRAAHFKAMQSLTTTQRKVYINTHQDWNQFQSAMLALSDCKCWYSEGPIGNNDFEVDHFRPKNKAVNYDGTITKQNGYWWKAYDWDNYRLTGALANKRRRDRLKKSDDVKGKGVYFPLDLINGSIADDEGNLSCELPLLLDPTKHYDVSLLTFDEKGVAIPATNEDLEINRVKLSVLYYHLDLEQLEKDRKIAWDDCVTQIEDAKQAIDNSPNIAAKTLMIEKCFKDLKKLVTENNRPYTSVRKACLMTYSEITGYHWLKNLVRTL
jgi:hypothetical protein